jgi:hypothetical protein
MKEHLKTLDDTGLSRFLIEASLIDSATNPYVEAELLDAAVKRYRVNADRIAESVAAEFAAKQKKRQERRATAAPKAQQGKARKNTKPKG